MSRSDLMLEFEREAATQGYRYVIGIDEAGRGPLAGPVVAAAVALDGEDFKNPIRDSKKLSFQQRERAFVEIYDRADVGVGIMSEQVIDQHNILNATFLAMNAAVDDLVGRCSPRFAGVREDQVRLFIDGDSFLSRVPFSYQTIIGGDARSLSVAAASIVAKVIRDRILRVYDKIFPQYGFARHKGYPTKEHREALERHGVSVIHRRTYQTVREACGLGRGGVDGIDGASGAAG